MISFSRLSMEKKEDSLSGDSSQLNTSFLAQSFTGDLALCYIISRTIPFVNGGPRKSVSESLGAWLKQ